MSSKKLLFATGCCCSCWCLLCSPCCYSCLLSTFFSPIHLQWLLKYIFARNDAQYRAHNDIAASEARLSKPSTSELQKVWLQMMQRNVMLVALGKGAIYPWLISVAYCSSSIKGLWVLTSNLRLAEAIPTLISWFRCVRYYDNTLRQQSSGTEVMKKWTKCHSHAEIDVD